MIESLVTLGLLSELLTGFGVNIASAAAFEWIAAKWRTTGVTNHDLQKALRESYCDALSSIEFGFHRQEGLLDSFGKRRLYREITSNFDKEFLTPFISETSISEDELENLTRDGATYCRILREAVDQLLPKEDISNITIEDLLLTGSKLEDADDLRRLNNKAKADLMASVHSVKDIPELFFDFLDYKDLLIGSLVFFYGEKIKANERVRSIFTHAELQRIREEQSQQYQKQATKLEKALQSQTSTFQQFLSPIKDNFTEVLTCLDRLESEWADTNKYLQRILDLITLDKGLSPKDKKQLEAGLSPSFDLHSKYEFDERKPVGYGAVATVYRAVHRGLRQVRAVKVLKPEHRENQELVERFLREAVVLGSLKHPNIIQIYDAGGGGPNLDFYLEMEYVEGVTLRNFIKSHEFNWQRNLKFIKQLGAAIQKMHESGIIHRDLNPRNIMVDKNGDLKVMDFGVA
jgi:tRNA A-37 threonylcarbamoyl transferase component Bud32